MKILSLIFKRSWVYLLIIVVGVLFYLTLMPVTLNVDQQQYLGLGLMIPGGIVFISIFISVIVDFNYMSKVKYLNDNIHELDPQSGQVHSISDRIEIFKEGILNFQRKNRETLNGVIHLSRQLMTEIHTENEFISHIKDFEGQDFFSEAHDFITKYTGTTSVCLVRYDNEDRNEYDFEFAAYFDNGMQKDIRKKILSVRNKCVFEELKFNTPVMEYRAQAKNAPIYYIFVPFLYAENAYSCLVLGFPRALDKNKLSNVLSSSYIYQNAYEDYLKRCKGSQLEEDNKYDFMLDVYNKRYGIKQINKSMAIVDKTKSSLALFVIDGDKFKSINDNYGHDGGDDTIRALGYTFKAIVEPLSGYVTRFGGEEFIICIENIDPVSAKGVAEKIRQTVQNTPINANGSMINITVSIGVAMYPNVRYRTYEELFKAADAAVYAAKDTGRNRVVFAD